MQYHFYADDTQLYVSFSSSASCAALEMMSATLDRVYNWFSVNRLSVNPSKTEYLLIGTPQPRAKMDLRIDGFSSATLEVELENKT